MSLIGDFKSGPILHLWLLDHAWLIRVCILSNPHMPSTGITVCCSHQGLATQGRWPHWAKTMRILNTLEHTWEC